MSERERGRIFEAFERWGFDEKGWARTTRHKYYLIATAADRWLAQHRGISLIYARPRDLRAYLFSTHPGVRGRNNIRAGLVGFGAFLVAQGFATENSAVDLPRLPEPEYLPKALSSRQALVIDATAPLFGPMVDALIAVYLYTGLRKSEARLLEWSNIREGWVTLRGKGGRERAVPLHPRVISALVTWRVTCPDPRWVFPSPRGTGQPVGDSWVKVRVRMVGDAADVPHLHPHLLRHTSATELLEAGADLRDVQEFLGHKNPKNTALYTKVRPGRLRDAVNRLDFRHEKGTQSDDEESSAGPSPDAVGRLQGRDRLRDRDGPGGRGSHHA